MKNKILRLIPLIALVLGLSACDDHNYGGEDVAEGSISFASFGVDVQEGQTVVESRTGIDVSGYLVKIVNTATGRVVMQSAYCQLPGVISLPVSDYKIKVESHEVQPAEFDRPYYAGETAVKVSANSISDAGKVTCRFSSIRVSIRYADNLRPLLGDDVTVTVNTSGTGELVFTPTDSRSGYFEAVEGSTTLVAIFRGTVNGQLTELRKELTDIKAGDHRIITFKIKLPDDFPDAGGTIDPSTGVTIDSSVENVDRNGNVTFEEDNLGGDDRPGQEGPEGPENPDNPNIPDKPDSDVSMTAPELVFDEQMDCSPKNGIVNIHADSGIAHLYIKVDTDNDDFRDIALQMFGEDKFDFADPNMSEESKAQLEPLGLSYGDAILNQTDVPFDISMFIPLLSGFRGTTTFNLTVVSNNGAELSKSLIFKAE